MVPFLFTRRVYFFFFFTRRVTDGHGFSFHTEVADGHGFSFFFADGHGEVVRIIVYV